MLYNKKGFTLVELIVVITILAILATIGYVSFLGYASAARDSSRIHNISIITRALEYYKLTNGKLPLPEESITLMLSGSIVGYQGEAGQKTLGLIGIADGGTDPIDGEYYSYFVSGNKPQVLTFLENDQSNLVYNIGNKSHAAVEYDSRYPYFKGEGLGMFLESDNTPIHKSNDLIISGKLDILDPIYASRLVKPLFTNTSNYTAKAIMVGGQLSLNSHTRTSQTCPNHYIPVPGNKELGQPGFCIGKYEAGEGIGEYDPYVTGPNITVGRELHMTHQHKECKGIGDRYNIMTINQWLTIARNIEQQGINWTGGSVGSGSIIGGNNGDDNRGYLDTGSSIESGDSLSIQEQKNDLDKKRVLTLSNGEEIWDFVGNVWELVKPLNLYGLENNKTELALINDNGSDIYDVLHQNTIAGLPIGGYVTWSNVIDDNFKKMYGPKIAITPEEGVGKVLKLSNESSVFVVGGDQDQSNKENGLYSIGIIPDETNINVGTRCAYNY